MGTISAGRGARAWGAPAVLVALGALAAAARAPRGDPLPEAGLAALEEQGLRRHVEWLADPALEGRDSPSLGLERAARYLAARFADLGLEPLRSPDYRLPFSVDAPEPNRELCALERVGADGAESVRFVLGRDFVPVAGCEGQASGSLVFLGFGIDAPSEHFDEVPARGLAGKIALVVEGEPRHRKRFDGEQVTRYAALWNKLADLQRADVAGVLVVRRATALGRRLPDELTGGSDADDVGFRFQWATWVGETTTQQPRDAQHPFPPVLEIDAACASALLGVDVEALARGSDENGKPPKAKKPNPVDVRMVSATHRTRVEIANVAARLPGSDPVLARQVLVLGAHYDHVGVDERGRVGLGADDNASGTAALLELAEALAAAPARRSVVFCAFAAEEKGLLGSKAFCDEPPFALSDAVAMLNMDMIGRGDPDEVAVLGVERNPDLERALEQARKSVRGGPKKVVVRQGQELWERSDHASFDAKGVPALFFFEGLPIERNPDYHTFRDTVERLDTEKMLRTARLVYATAWNLANANEAPARTRD